MSIDGARWFPAISLALLVSGLSGCVGESYHDYIASMRDSIGSIEIQDAGITRPIDPTSEEGARVAEEFFRVAWTVHSRTRGASVWDGMLLDNETRTVWVHATENRTFHLAGDFRDSAGSTVALSLAGSDREQNLFHICRGLYCSELRHGGDLFAIDRAVAAALKIAQQNEGQRE